MVPLVVALEAEGLEEAHPEEVRQEDFLAVGEVVVEEVHSAAEGEGGEGDLSRQQ